jgi:hypothetical protein
MKVFLRSDKELMQSRFRNKKVADFVNLVLFFIPLFGISKNKELRIRWLVYAFYFGGTS